MKIKRFKSLLPYLAAVVIASMLAPIGALSPLPARADAGIMRWETVSTPGSVSNKNDILSYVGDNLTGSEVRDLSIGNNGMTIIAAVTVDNRTVNASYIPGPLGMLMYSSNAGISWSTAAYLHLIASGGWTAGNQVYNVLISPDDPKLWALTAGTAVNGPTEFWVTQDGGATWNNTQAPAMAAGEAIGAIDISIDYGTGRDLMLATRTGTGKGHIFMTNTAGFSAWIQQANPTTDDTDFFAVKFSPTYNGDQTFVVIMATGAGTFYNIGLRDVKNNSTLAWVYPGNGVTVSTPTFATLSVADLSLPSDFSGQSTSLRRAFVSLAQSGIFRIDDSSVTALLPLAGINSIDFFGTYSQGKLIAGSVMGVPCLAAVPTIYMDTPCICAGSCSMPSLKPPTGAGNQGLCSGSPVGIGAAVVRWNSDGSLAYAATGSAANTIGISVTTGPGVYVSPMVAAFSGILTSLNDTSATVSFEYGLTTAYGSTTATSVITTASSFVLPAVPLATMQIYHYRAKAVGNTTGITVYGSDATYIQSGVLTVSTGGAVVSGVGTAQLSGTLGLGTDLLATVSFDYGPTAAYGSTTSSSVMTSGGTFSSSATGLVPGNTYHFKARAVGSPSGMTVLGLDTTYIHPLNPSLAVSTGTSTTISPTSVTLNGTLTSLGTDATAAVSFDYGISDQYGSNIPASVPGPVLSSGGVFNAVVPGLIPGQPYHFRAKAVGLSGTVVYGPDATYISANAYWWKTWIGRLVPNDESALSISRNNGDTWNQLSLIDTTIDWFNDVAVSSDCTTVYLASVHRNVGIGCNEFDSVWRSTISPGVSAPLPAIPPIGTYWERVLTHTTSASCTVPQSDLPILRTVPSCTDSSDGGVVAWAARFEPTSLSGTGGVMAWSPDYGDYWVAVMPRYPVEDFTFESSSVIYVAGITGMVQKLVYTGTAWSTNLPGADSGVIPHTIVARNGKVLVGANLIFTPESTPIAYSADSGANFQRYRDYFPVTGMVHAIFDTDFEKNRFIYAAVGDNVTGTVYRNTAPVFTRWTDNDMMDVSNGATGSDWSAETPPVGPNPPHQRGYYSIVMAFTGNGQPALYAAHDNITTAHFGITAFNSAVCRTLEPRNGMPKPGIYWDCLDVFQPPSVSGVHFTLEPSSLKACGCCSPNTNTTLYAIDNQSGFSLDNINISYNGNVKTLIDAWSAVLPGRYLQTPGYNPGINQGMLWAYTDCLAKKGPALRTPADKALVGADPVTGRNQQIDLSWEQLCLSTVYELQVAKDANFTLRINPAISNSRNIASVAGSIKATMDEVNMTRPGMWLSPAALPEAGAIYFWRVRSYKSATGQIAVSPWSEARSFSVKPGFIVNTPYYGVQLLAPDNGCVGCKVRPASFSWSPWKEATRYEFVLSKDSEFKQVLKQASASSTGYEYDGTLDYDTNYFWRVRAIEVNGQAIPSDWSATFSFRTESAPGLPGSLPGEPGTPLWVWIIIGLGTILVIVTLVLILRTSR